MLHSITIKPDGGIKFSIFLNPFFKKNWSIVASQCCVSFCCIARWISHAYTNTPSSLDFLPIWVTTEHWVEFPVLYSLFSLVIYFIHSSLCLSILNPFWFQCAAKFGSHWDKHLNESKVCKSLTYYYSYLVFSKRLILFSHLYGHKAYIISVMGPFNTQRIQTYLWTCFNLIHFL